MIICKRRDDGTKGGEEGKGGERKEGEKKFLHTDQTKVQEVLADQKKKEIKK